MGFRLKGAEVTGKDGLMNWVEQMRKREAGTKRKRKAAKKSKRANR
jgi:hypothetical protein